MSVPVCKRLWSSIYIVSNITLAVTLPYAGGANPISNIIVNIRLISVL